MAGQTCMGNLSYSSVDIVEKTKVNSYHYIKNKKNNIIFLKKLLIINYINNNYNI
jgi:hypothetical protein